MIFPVHRRRLLIGLGATLLFALMASGTALWRYREQRAALVADGMTLHRVLSQRVDQHDAHMTGLSALAQAADPPPVEAIRQVAASIVRFYPRIIGIDILDLANPARPPMLGSDLVPEGIFDAISASTAVLTVVPVAGSERIMLVKRVPPGKVSSYLIVFLIDLRQLIETDRFGAKPEAIQLLLEERSLLSTGSAEQTAPVVFEAPLASRTQPLLLRVASPIKPGGLFPWPALLLAGIGLMVGAIILDRMLAARASARDAGARALLATQDARLAHASRVNAMGELASGIAHELTQPLTAILSQSQAGQRIAARPELDRNAILAAFDATARNAKRAGDILGKLRSWVTKAQPVVEIVDLVSVIRDVIHLTAADAEAVGAKVLFEGPTRARLVRADRIQLEQVLFNLVRNALEAARGMPHPAQITIRLATEGGVASVRVRDNGPGFSPEVHARLFEPFFTTKREGMGLGLALCTTLVERFGGTISAANIETGGAELLVQLPLASQNRQTSIPEAAE